jgi:peptide deformylase
LRRPAQKLTKVPPNLKQLTDDMIETMHVQQGVGLAANQIGSLQKVAVIQLPDWTEALVLINPEIVKREGELELEEGCLSIPGYRGLVKRSARVRARAIGLDGKAIRIKAEGLLAQALEHETDHLNGTLYIDRLVARDKIWKIGQRPEDEGHQGHGHEGHTHQPLGGAPPPGASQATGSGGSAPGDQDPEGPAPR